MSAKPKHHDILRLAIEHHRAGRLDLARQVLEPIAAADPANDDVQHRLGVICCAMGEARRAVELFDRAVKASPGVAEYRNSLGLALRASGKALAAVDNYRKAIELRPELAQFPYNLANVLREMGDGKAAAATYQRAMALSPGFAEAHNNLASVLNQDGALREAIAFFRTALQIDPLLSVSYVNLGQVLQAIGRYREATEHFRAVARLMPQPGSLLIRLGWSLSQLGVTADAIGMCCRAMALAPDDPSVHIAVAELLGRQGEADLAIARLGTARALEPRSIGALCRLARLHLSIGRTDTGVRLLEHAWRISGNRHVAIELAQIVPAVPHNRDSIVAARAKGIDWLDRAAPRRGRIDRGGPGMQGLSPALIFSGLNDRRFHEQIAAAYLQTRLPAPVAIPPPDSPRPARGNRRLRLGIFVPNRHDGDVDRLFADFAIELPRDEIRLIGLFAAPPIGARARAIKARCDVIMVLPGDGALAADAVAQNNLDVMIFPDVTSDPLAYGLACYRHAPIQGVLWGHPVTTGLPNIDVFFSARGFEPAGARQHYTERLIELERPPVFARRREPGGRDRGALKLPDQCHLYACMTSLAAIHPDFDELLGAIAQADAKAKFVLRHDGPTLIRNQFLDRAKDRAAGLADRFIFLSSIDLGTCLDVLAHADVVLAPSPVDSLAQAYDALAVAAPLVCLAGDQLRGRAAYGLLKLIGVEDGIARDRSDYVYRAVELACRPRRRARYRDRLSVAAPALFEDRQAVSGFTQCLIELSGKAAQDVAP